MGTSPKERVVGTRFRAKLALLVFAIAWADDLVAFVGEAESKELLARTS
jgi:hypothetical protein